MESTTNDWLSKKALDIIRRAKEEKYTQIKLAGYGLEQLPDELFDLEELENLDISYNGFTELPPAIARMTHLRFLDLRGNNLQNLPAEISKLSELKHLDLSENPLQCLPEPANVQLMQNAILTKKSYLQNIEKIKVLIAIRIKSLSIPLHRF
jgi:Leucine-rich repeat (LRR) protein